MKKKYKKIRCVQCGKLIHRESDESWFMGKTLHAKICFHRYKAHEKLLSDERINHNNMWWSKLMSEDQKRRQKLLIKKHDDTK